MDVVVQKSKSDIFISLTGSYLSEDYGHIMQHFADTEVYKNKNLKVDCSELAGYEFKILNLIIVLAKNLGDCKSFEMILNDSLNKKTTWFEPVWSSIVKKG